MLSDADDFIRGYRDGRTATSPQPNDSRTPAYRHSFAVGRLEVAKQMVIPAPWPMQARVYDICRELLARREAAIAGHPTPPQRSAD